MLESLNLEEYSLSDLVDVTGAKRRSLQLWAERGLIRAMEGTENAGTGVHRLFSRDEAIVACIAHAFAIRQISIGELLFICGGVRSILHGRRDLIESAVTGNGDTILSYESWWEEGQHKQSVALRSAKEIHFQTRREAGAMLMVIRLETFLSKLR
jgi:hypothetical protein